MKFTFKALIIFFVALSSYACQGPNNYDPADRHYSQTFEPMKDTPMGRAITMYKSQRPADSSGFYLLHDGLSAFVARVALIEAASQSLDLQYYIFANDTSGKIIISKLLEAADRGVRIRLLVDDLGTRVENPQVVALDRHPNIEIRLFNPVVKRNGVSRALEQLWHFGRINHRMHNKLFIADSLTMITGGRNIADEYFSSANIDFQDIDIIAVGAILPNAMRSFDEYWNSDGAIPVSLLFSKSESLPNLSDIRQSVAQFLLKQQHSEYSNALHNSSLAQTLLTGNIPMTWGEATLYVDPPQKALDHEHTEVEQYLGYHLKDIIEQANHSLKISSAYFVPGQEGAALLTKKRQQGVEVSILTNALSTTDVAIVHSGYSRYRKTLLEQDVQLWELRSTAGQKQRIHWFKGKSKASLHAKTMVIDNNAAFVGSVNLDGRSFIQNTEIGLYIESDQINRQLSDLFDAWISPENAWQLSLDQSHNLTWQAHDNNHTITLKKDPETSTWQRFKVWLLGLLPLEAQI